MKQVYVQFPTTYSTFPHSFQESIDGQLLFPKPISDYKLFQKCTL